MAANEKKHRRPQITCYPSREICDVVEAIAADDRRTVSQMGAILIEEALTARKAWPPKKK